MGACHGAHFRVAVANKAACCRSCGADILREICVRIMLKGCVVKSAQVKEVRRYTALEVIIITQEGREITLIDWRSYIVGQYVLFQPHEHLGETLQVFMERMLSQPGCLHIIRGRDGGLNFEIHHKPKDVKPMGAIVPDRLWALAAQMAA